MENPRILIIDDNIENINFLESILPADKFEIFVATSAEKGFLRAKSTVPHLILLDILMPEEDGYSLCRRLKNNRVTKDIPVIFVSALSETIDKTMAFQAGGVDFMTKPLNGDELIARINTHISIVKLRNELKSANEALEQRVLERTAELIIANEELQIEILDRKNAEAFAIKATHEWEDTFNALSDAICIIDDKHNILRSNKAMALTCFNDENAQLSGMKCYKCMHNTNTPVELCPHQELLKDGKAHRQEIFEPTTNKYFSVSVVPIFNNNGNLYASVHAAHDITELKINEQAIKESEEKFRNIFNSSNDEIFITDTTGNILEINKKAKQRFDCEYDDCQNKNISYIIHPSRREDFQICLTNVLIKENAIFETESIKIMGEKSFLEITLKPINYHQKTAVLFVIRDITERRMLQQKVVASIIEAEEKERARVAGELHDGLGPLLSALKLYVQWMSKPDSLSDRDDVATQAENTLEEAISTVKEISNNLSPNVLTKLGLKTAIQSFVKKVNNKGLKIETKIRVPPALKKEVEIMLYRILCESINNTIKYAHARNANIEIDYVDNLLAIVYKDDGTGFSVNEVLQNAKGNGLMNMKNRVETLGGNITITSALGEGMRVSILYPLEKNI